MDYLFLSCWSSYSNWIQLPCHTYELQIFSPVLCVIFSFLFGGAWWLNPVCQACLASALLLSSTPSPLCYLSTFLIVSFEAFIKVFNFDEVQISIFFNLFSYLRIHCQILRTNIILFLCFLLNFVLFISYT